MLIRNGKAFARGLLLMGSFIVVFVLFFMPIFPNADGGEKTNGLVYADHLFNTLSKGSSYFYDPTLKDQDSVDAIADKMKGKQVDVEVSLKDAKSLALAQTLAEKSGLTATAGDGKLKLKGELYPLLVSLIKDSLSMYNNNADEVAARYGAADGKAVVKAAWQLGSAMIKPLQKVGNVDEASTISKILTRAVEPGYNFYGITPLKVKDNVPLVAGFLIFYVIYTMWYGFAIFELFEGIGLSMKKGVKKEV